MARKSKKTRRSESNRNSFILNRPNQDAQVGGFTFTKRRDADALKVSARTSSNNATEVVITRYQGDERLVLSGAEARTLQRVLNKHYGEAY
jgi:hypothetical protein